MLVACLTNPDDASKVGALADLIEYRLDYFPDLFHLKKPPLPSIFTFRRKDQGGARELPENERIALIEHCLALGPDYCDLEADTDPVYIERIAKRFPNVKLIGSFHDFHETAHDLDSLLQRMKNPHFSLYKIATLANSTADLLRLMLFAKEATVPLSVMAMGEYGQPSRILGPIVGSLLTYSGLEEELHLNRYSLQTLHEVYHFRKLNRQTQVYALIGDPVEQSPGDLFHNPRFKKNAVYIKMKMGREDMAASFPLIRKLPFAGFSVTIPLKEAIFPYVDEVEPAARSIKAINTLTFHKHKIVGTNTDAPGALNAIERHLKVKGKRVAILGAGGTARAIAFEAKLRGALVSVFNRTLERAKTLGKGLGIAAYSLTELAEHPYDILVNTIPPKLASVPQIRPVTVVMDVVYYPKETPLLGVAKKLGCLCIYGEEMFKEQAALQQKEWISLSKL